MKSSNKANNDFVKQGNKSSSNNENGKNLRLQNILDGTILTRDNSIKFLPFLFYLSFLAILYIGNIYYAEKTVREIEKTKSELKELRYKFIAAKAELMFQSKQSEVAKNLEANGIKESMTPPQKIYKDKK